MPENRTLLERLFSPKNKREYIPQITPQHLVTYAFMKAANPFYSTGKEPTYFCTYKKLEESLETAISTINILDNHHNTIPRNWNSKKIMEEGLKELQKEKYHHSTIAAVPLTKSGKNGGTYCSVSRNKIDHYIEEFQRATKCEKPDYQLKEIEYERKKENR